MKKKQTENGFTKHKTEDPFVIIEKDKNIFVTIGNRVMSSKKFKNVKEADEYVKSKPYELIINAACFVTNEIQKIDKQNVK